MNDSVESVSHSRDLWKLGSMNGSCRDARHVAANSQTGNRASRMRDHGGLGIISEYLAEASEL